MLESALTTLLIAAQLSLQPTPAYKVEREPLENGGELVTLFQHRQDSNADPADIPVLSILRDTLGDNNPDNDRLRYVWILTGTRPTMLQRTISALSFSYFRVGTKRRGDSTPQPVLDLASPGKNVWSRLLSDGLQALQFDSMGAVVRSSTRSYRGNSRDYFELKTQQALTALDGLQREPEGQQLLPEADLREVYCRLSLSNRPLGGLVKEEHLDQFYDRQAMQSQQNRSRNWELLRQRVETDGLYFEPLAAPNESPIAGIVWIARSDLEDRRGQHFDGKFLNIANPWTDDRLLNWNGYTEARYFDGGNRVVAPDTPGAHKMEMIPLALYSLDYPRVPLLLVDFRDHFNPKQRELSAHFMSTLLTGVLGIARFSNGWFLAANSVWTFVRTRHGATLDRSARIRAYSEALEFLNMDSTLASQLKIESLRRLNHLAVNPLENSSANEAAIARQQYAALLRYARSPRGLGAKVNRDRHKELEAYTQSQGKRFLLNAGRLITRGPQVPVEEATNLRTELDGRRQTAHQVRFLKELLASSPRPEVVWDPEEIRRSVEALAAEPPLPSVPSLIARVFERSEDGEIRTACLRALAHFRSEEARNELAHLSEAAGTSEGWRRLCLLYLNGGVAEVFGAADTQGFAGE